jgi:hypothetical protein
VRDAGSQFIDQRLKQAINVTRRQQWEDDHFKKQAMRSGTPGKRYKREFGMALTPEERKVIAMSHQSK